MTIVKLISLLLICGTVFATDLIQVDVGNKIKFTGVLNMSVTENQTSLNHGTQMALALEDELKIQHSKPVYAKQLVWDLSGFSLIRALSKALDSNPKVLSLSYSGEIPNFTEEAVLMAHRLNDTVIVVAAGNKGNDEIQFPSGYDNPCILSVGTTIDGVRAVYSNKGKVWLDYNPKDPSGTSASTARMAGIVLQLRRNHPQFTCDKIVLTARMLYGKVKR